MRAAIPGRRGLRGPEAAIAAGWPAQDRQQARGGGTDLVLQSGAWCDQLYPQPFEVGIDPGSAAARSAAWDRLHCEGFDPGSE